MVHPIPDCGLAQTYLIVDEDDSIMVVDVGSVGAARAVEDFCIHTLKRSLRAIRFIAATHFHIDHIGGISALLEKCSPKTTVLFHPLVKAYLKAGRPLSPMRNWFTGLVPTLIGGEFGIRKWSDLAFGSPAGIPLPFFRDRQCVSYGDRIRYLEEVQPPAFCADQRRYRDGLRRSGSDDMPLRYLDGNRLPRSRIGFDGWEVIGVPGHTEESVVFFNETSGELITGDLILGRKGGRGYVNRFCWDEAQIRRTFTALMETIRVRIIYPGHGPVMWSADDALQKVDCFGKASASDGFQKICFGDSRNGLPHGMSGKMPSAVGVVQKSHQKKVWR